MKITDDTKEVISAIKSLKLRVTQADVARSTGLSLSTVSHNLNELAFESQGRMWVSPEGELMYEFPRRFDRRLKGKSLIAKVFHWFFSCFKYLFKMSFGLMLFMSLLSLTIVLLVMEVVVRALGSIGGGDSGGDFLSGALLVGVFQLIFSEVPLEPTSEGKKSLNFGLACYYFVCGNGDPNRDLEDRQWKLIAELIDRNAGVLTRQQLLPFTYSTKDVDRILLEALVRFEGTPEVSEAGNIVCVFPKLRHTVQEVETSPDTEHDAQVAALELDSKSEQVIVAETPEVTGVLKKPDYLEERYWQFAGIGVGGTLLVGFVAVLNLLGTYGLVSVLFKGHELFTALGLYSILLFLYAIVFLAYPLLRLNLNAFRNLVILFRNSARHRMAMALLKPDRELAELFEEAKSFSIKKIQTREEDAVFDTGKDSLEQQFEVGSR